MQQVLALIKFLNQLSDDDKNAALKFLIVTLKNYMNENSRAVFPNNNTDDNDKWIIKCKKFDNNSTSVNNNNVFNFSEIDKFINIKTESNQINDYANVKLEAFEENSIVENINCGSFNNLNLNLNLLNLNNNNNVSAIVPWRRNELSVSAINRNQIVKLCLADDSKFNTDIRILFGTKFQQIIKLFLNDFNDNCAIKRNFGETEWSLMRRSRMIDSGGGDGDGAGGGSGSSMEQDSCDMDKNKIVPTMDDDENADEQSDAGSDREPENLKEISDKQSTVAGKPEPKKRKVFQCFQCDKV